MDKKNLNHPMKLVNYIHYRYKSAWNLRQLVIIRNGNNYHIGAVEIILFYPYVKNCKKAISQSRFRFISLIFLIILAAFSACPISLK